MLQAMRQNTKIILWIVVVSFVLTIFAVWGLDLRTGQTGSDPNVIGKVNGVPVTRAQYQSIYNQFSQQMQAGDQNQPLTYAQEEFLRSQAWDNLVYSVLTDQEIERLGITVSDDEVVFYLRNSPPVEIRQYFLDDNGNFDNQAYQQALNNPDIDWTNLEQLARERIPRIKLNEYISAQVHVSEDETRRAYEEETIKLSISYVLFPFEEVDPEESSPPEDEMRAYYDAHPEEFEKPEQARIELITVDLVPSPSDVAEAVTDAEIFYDQLREGEDFGQWARDYSEAPTSFVDGATGFIQRGQREEAYFDALDGLAPGEVAPPVRTESGVYIVKLVEKRPSEESGEQEYSAQEILIEPKVSRETLDSLSVMLEEVRARALEAGLETAAREHGLTYSQPAPFVEGGLIEELGFVAALSRFAFSSNPPPISNELRDEDHVYLARLIERLPKSMRSFEEARDELADRVLQERMKARTHDSASAFFRKARSTDLETAAREPGFEVTAIDSFRAVDNIEPFGPQSSVAAASLVVEPGELVPPFETLEGYVVLVVRSRSEFNEEEYRARVAQVQMQIRSQKAQQYAAYWYESLKARSSIEDYRTNI